ncbi:MAG: flagellar basal-body rod protein FlgF [Chromatiales bacterium 21-64-14]|nr:MAG: flagellar basal-body rod protein FlgF [Chromatiales bacterium 21-64-14]HQU15104.1 flagellar basal-body rod protein FlgF [Gammaproteobacteria bacterium]
MDRVLYIAMSGAQQTMLAQAANSQNLANANTTGFRSELSAFRSQPVFGPGYPSRVYAMAESPGVNYSSGTLESTGRTLDVAVSGPGWIAVQAPDGSEAYTRAGDLRITTAGILETSTGFPVLGNGGPLAVPPHQKLAIGRDGTVSVVPLGQQPNTLAVVDRIKLVNPSPSDLQRSADGLFVSRSGKPVPPDANVQLISGALETSNVNPVNAMVNMIELAQAYEMQVKVMSTARQNDAATTQLMVIQ